MQEDLQEDLKKVSQERIRTSDNKEELDRDSFDSALYSERRVGADAGYTKLHSPNEEQPETASTPPTKTNLSPVVSEENGAKQANRKEQGDLDDQAHVFVQRAMAAYAATQGNATGRGGNGGAKAKPNALVSAFVREVSPLFRDQNVKASLTRALRAVEQTSLLQKDILACLVKAYLVTQETKRVREQYRRADGDIKMPLFCTMFTRFTTDCAAGKFGYTDEHLARDIAQDDRLVLFVVEHRLEALLLEEETPEGRERVVQQEESPVLEENAATNVSASQPSSEQEVQAEEVQLEQPMKQQPQIIDAESPDRGWQTYDGAFWWADKLRDHLGYDTYNFAVYPTQYGRHGFIFFLRTDPSQQGRFLTRDEVKQYL